MSKCLPHPTSSIDAREIWWVCAFHPGGPWPESQWENPDETPCPTARQLGDTGRDTLVLSVVDQPPPEPNDLPAIWDLVAADMKERDQVGRERYGTPLQPFNGRDALVDAYQEALDLVVYLRQAIYERDNGVPVEVTQLTDPDRTFLVVPRGEVHLDHISIDTVAVPGQEFRVVKEPVNKSSKRD